MKFRSLLSSAAVFSLAALWSMGTAHADLIKQGAPYNRTVLVTDSSDHITGKDGLTLTVTLSKAGAAFASITPTVTPRGGGKYTIALTSAQTDTAGALDMQINPGTGADPVDTHDQVIGADLNDTAGLGLSRLDVATSTRQASGAAVTLPTLPNVTIGAYAGGVVPPDSAGTGTLLTRLPQPLLFSSGGFVKAFSTLDLSQVLDPTNLGDTLGGALVGARAQAFGKWVITGTAGTAGSTLKIYAADGTTLLRTFSLATSGNRQ